MRPSRGTIFAAAAVMVLILCTTVLAVPSLQTYSPDAFYNTATESWLTYADPFELQVLGATTPAKIEVIDNLTLLIAVPNDYWDPTAQVVIKTISNPADNNPLPLGTIATLDISNLTSGDQPGEPDVLGYFDGKNFPWHGIYPARFWAVPLAPLQVVAAGETVYDYIPGGTGSDSGDVQYYEISYSPYSVDFMLHIDLVGYAHNGQSKWVFAPFSHDADAGAVPEPATAALLALGIAGLGIAGRRFRRRR